jgi:hypothetical protein
MREMTVGPATGGVNVQAWSFKAKSPEDRRGMRVWVCGTILVADQCLPVSILDRGMVRRGRPHVDENDNVLMFDQSEDELDVDRRGRGGSMKFIVNEVYSSVKPSVDDPSVFTPPTYCNATLSTMSRESLLFDEDYDSYADILERYVSF